MKEENETFTENSPEEEITKLILHAYDGEFNPRPIRKLGDFYTNFEAYKVARKIWNLEEIKPEFLVEFAEEIKKKQNIPPLYVLLLLRESVEQNKYLWEGINSDKVDKDPFIREADYILKLIPEAERKLLEKKPDYVI